MSNYIGIRGYDYVEFYVGSAKMWAYWHAKAMGLKITGYMGPESGVKDRVSYYLTRDKLKFVFTSAVKPGNYDVGGFYQKHGDGVKRWALEVDDVKKAFEGALINGAVPVRNPKKLAMITAILKRRQFVFMMMPRLFL